jgi:heme A synthase
VWRPLCEERPPFLLAGRHKGETMKHLKMLGLAAIAVGAFVAFVGAGTASAEWNLCTENAACPTGHNAPETGIMWEESDIIVSMQRT